MTFHRTSLLLRASAVLLVATPLVATAQTRVREAAADTAAGIPRGMMPPAGKCRVWMDGVPATRQPAPTDCATALRKKPANARVIYGPNAPEQRQAGLDRAREGKRSLLTPIGERRPALAQDGPRQDPRQNANPAVPRARTAAPAPTTRPTVRTVPPATPAPPPADNRKAVPPKKPERP